MSSNNSELFSTTTTTLTTQKRRKKTPVVLRDSSSSLRLVPYDESAHLDAYDAFMRDPQMLLDTKTDATTKELKEIDLVEILDECREGTSGPWLVLCFYAIDLDIRHIYES